MATPPALPDAAAAPRRSKLPLLTGLVAALAAGAGGFYVTWSGLIAAPRGQTAAAPTAIAPMAFVALDPVTINLAPGAQARHLRFAAQLEVPPAHQAEVTRLAPRVLDVLNTYLRALEPHELEHPAALMRLRAQMLRRVLLVTGEGRVSDILITEFVMN
jgi:flagellar FliL protein